MILVLDTSLNSQQQNDLCLRLQTRGFFTRLVNQYGQLIVSVEGPKSSVIEHELASWQGVKKVVGDDNPYYLSSRDCLSGNSIVEVGGHEIKFGSNEIISIAGPCAIETEEVALEIAHQVKEAGCRIFRSMIFKPRSSPYSFQGLGRAGIPILQKIRQQTGLKILTEVRDPIEAELVLDHVDMLQVGARNMSNFQLLKYLGQINRPVLLKRGMGASIEELLCAAEYLISHGNTEVILCERGIRSFDRYTRFCFDIAAVPALKQLSHLPVVVDPSHACGKSSLVGPLTLASVAAGADGVMLETHVSPEKAYSDGTQSINPEELIDILHKGRKIAATLGRTLK